jgi:ATP-dependent exoDNAse (exonuclease V) beta subunit
MARALAPRFGLDADAAQRAAAEVAAVLALPVLDRARAAPRVHRELRVWFPDGEHLVEGQVDLVFEEADGLVVVDYKTDAWADAGDLDAKVARYRLQGATYALALATATGRPVTRCVFVFLAPEGAQEREVSDLPGAVEEVRALLAESSAAATTP